MLILLISIYIILGFIIGTLLISEENPRLYTQLKNENDTYYSSNNYVVGYLVGYIIIYYILWPLPLIKFSWFKFWKYIYIGFQIIIICLSKLIEDISYYFKNKLINDIKEKLK